MITVKDGVDVDIGANPSAEEQEESLEEGTRQVNNVINAFGLQSTSFDKKSYTTYIKGYLKKIKAYLEQNNPERAPVFEELAKVHVKKILTNFKGMLYDMS